MGFLMCMLLQILADLQPRRYSIKKNLSVRSVCTGEQKHHWGRQIGQRAVQTNCYMLILLKGLIWSGTGKSFLPRGCQCRFRTVCLWGSGLNKQWNSLTIKKKIFYTVVLQPFLKENGSWGGNWKEHIIFREM